jgi:hypothetical protein
MQETVASQAALTHFTVRHPQYLRHLLTIIGTVRGKLGWRTVDPNHGGSFSLEGTHWLHGTQMRWAIARRFLVGFCRVTHRFPVRISPDLEPSFGIDLRSNQCPRLTHSIARITP